MLQTLETKLNIFPGMEEKTYKRWFPSTPTEMPVGTPRELPNSFPIELPLREKILHTQDSFRMECYGFVNNTEPNFPQIKPSYNGVVVPHPKINGVDLHDSYKIDRYGNPYNGHTTINLPKKEKIRIDHGW